MKKRNKIRDLNNLETPDELKLENEERRTHQATFDRVDLVIQFQPGKDQIGAVVQKFTDAITQHDIIVKEIEQQMNVIEEIKKMYRKKVRLFRTLDNTWNLIYTNPTEFTEYLGLLPKMVNIEKRLATIDDIEIKTKLQAMYERFQYLDPKCSRQKIIYELYQEARREKEAVTKEYVEAEKVFNHMKETEKQLAGLISDDHMLADEKGISLTELFPNIHVGYILTRINQYQVEQMPYEEVAKCIIRAKSPHKIECKRYDYRYNVFEKKWYSLEELRQQGVVVENPLLRKTAFIAAAAKGDRKVIKQYLDEGEDPNATDLTGNTAIVTASVNKHIEAVELLHAKGADINARDKNYMTPLLYVINRGYLDLVRLLVAYGADKTAVDRHGHGCFYYAILSRSLPLVKMFFNPLLKNQKEKLWGFTALHLAANIGDLPIVEYLLSQKCSIYQVDYSSRTAEEVARESKHYHIQERLQTERIQASGQCIYYDKDKQFQLWIGDRNCLEMEWILDLEFSAIFYFHVEDRVPLEYQWLLKQEEYKQQIDRILRPPTSPPTGTTGAGDASKRSTALVPISNTNNSPMKKKRTNIVPRKSRLTTTSNSNTPLAITGPAPPPSLSPEITRTHRHALIQITSQHRQRSSSSPTQQIEEGEGAMVVYTPSEMVKKSNSSNNKNNNEVVPATTGSSPTNRKTSRKTGKRPTNISPPSRRRPRGYSEDDYDDLDEEAEEGDYEEEEDDDLDDDEQDFLLDLNEDQIQFFPCQIPIDPEDGDNHDQWSYLLQYLPQVMDILPIYHLHRHEELLAKQSTYSSLQPSGDGGASIGESTRFSLLTRSMISQLTASTQRTKSATVKKVLLCDDAGDSLSPAMAAMYLLLKQSQRVQQTIAEMKACRPTIELGPNLTKGLEEVQYKYDEKVLKKLNAKLRESVVTSIAF